MYDAMITNKTYEITNPYASGHKVSKVYIHPSTSADGWKYHKPNKKQKKNRR